MTATAHAIVGAAIATKFTNPAISLPLALVSHFVCDKVPHWDVMTDKGKPRGRLYRELVLDYLLSLLVVLLYIVLFKPETNPVLIFASVLVAQSPDWFEAPFLLLKLNFMGSQSFYRFQKWSHDVWFDSRLKAPWGVVTEAAVMLLFFLWGISR